MECVLAREYRGQGLGETAVCPLVSYSCVCLTVERYMCVTYKQLVYTHIGDIKLFYY